MSTQWRARSEKLDLLVASSQVACRAGLSEARKKRAERKEQEVRREARSLLVAWLTRRSSLQFARLWPFKSSEEGSWEE